MKTEKSTRKVVIRSPQRKVGYINCGWFQQERIEHEFLLEKRVVQCALLCLRLKYIKASLSKYKSARKVLIPQTFCSHSKMALN